MARRVASLRTKRAFSIVPYFVPLILAAQASNVIPLASEPHHHLALHNDYVNVYYVQVAPQDSVLLHRHDFDALGVTIGDSTVIVRVPGKADARQELRDGQLRLQPQGYVHSTYVDGSKPYRNTAVELLRPQRNSRNLCAPVIASAPVNCPVTRLSDAPVAPLREPQFESDQTYVTLIHVSPHRSFDLRNSRRDQLIVAVDDLLMTSEKTSENSLQAGTFMWLEMGSGYSAKNDGDKEIRLISFAFEPSASSSADH
jgi:hypothetical protein